MNSTDAPRISLWPLSTLTAIAAINAIAVAVSGGFEVSLPWFEISSSRMARPFVATFALVAISFVATGLRDGAFGAMVKRGLVLGAPVVALLAAGASVAALRGGVFIDNRLFLACMAALGALAVLMAAGMYGRRGGKTGAAAVTVNLVLAGMVLVFSSHNLVIWEPNAAFRFNPPASLAPLTPGQGDEAPAMPWTLGGQTRPARVVEGEGFFRLPVPGTGEQVLTFAIGNGSAVGLERKCKARVTAWLAGGHSDRTVAYEREFDEEDLAFWNEISVPLDSSAPGLAADLAVTVDPPGRVAVAGPRFRKAADDRPNVILLVVDTLRADHLGTYGCDRATSPALDRVAAWGRVYADARSAASWTLPAMASIFTGLYPAAHGLVTSHGMLPAVRTLPEYLEAAGYTCAGFQTNPLLTVDRGFANGFSRYDHFPEREPSSIARDVWECADSVNRGALDWVDTNQDRPFFLYVHYMDVHTPYAPPAGYARFGDRPVDLYDGSTLYATDSIADFITRLKDRGLLENTIVFLTSDHGEQFNEHGREGHGKGLHPEEISVPLVVWGPGIEPGRVNGLVENFDVMPSILDVAGVQPGDSVMARSLWSPSSRAPQPPKDAAYGHVVVQKPVGEEFWAVETAGGKLIIDINGGGRWLYDPSADPGETRPLEALPAASRLEELLDGKRLTTAEVLAGLGGGANLDLSADQIRALRALGYMN